MADLQAIALLADGKGLNFTGPLSHQQAQALAVAWRPEVRFHEDEYFFPVDINGLYTIPPDVFDQLSAGSQQEFAINIDGTAFTPPVLRNGSNVLASGEITAAELNQQVVNPDSILTHGKSFTASTQFFGSISTITGQPNPAPGDPREPRHPIVYRAEVRLLYEALKFELELDALDDDQEKPEDSIWRGFQVEDSFFARKGGSEAAVFPSWLKRQILKSLVDAYDPENPDNSLESEALTAMSNQLPLGWYFIRNAWEVIKRFGFVEYYFVYAYNDFDRYESPYGNKHEGDDEGCCVVFDRAKLEEMASDFINNPPEGIAPACFITSVHEEWQGSDRMDANISIDPVRARQDLVAYVARGSHATYLDAGSFDVLDFGDAALLPFKGPTWLAVVNILTGGLLSLISALGEHFMDSEDQTSNDGVSTPGPPNADTEAPLVFGAETVVTPLSDIKADDSQNIYKNALGPNIDEDALLALGRRAYAGKIGAHNSLSDHSPQFKTKTARYFRKLLRGVNSGAVPLSGPIQ